MQNKIVLRIALLIGVVIIVGYFFLSKDESPSGVEPTDTMDVISSLHPIKVNNLVGFINQDGKIVIEPMFAQVTVTRGYTHEELIPVKQTEKGKVGYIDKKGDFVIEPQFEAALPFQENAALVMNNGKVGYINTEGSYIIEPTYSIKDFPFSEGIETLFFSEGMAPVQVEGQGWGYIDKTGKLIVEPQYEFASSFKEGLAAVKMDGLYGFIDQSGEIIIQPQYQHALPFSEGLAAIQVEDNYGYIKKSSEVVISPKYSKASTFKEGLAAVYKKLTANGGETDLGTTVGYINKVGEEVIPISFEGDDYTNFSFHEGLALVRRGFDFGFIDKTGEVVIPYATYDNVYPYSQGLALATSGSRQIYMDKTGKIVYSK
jgi:hypothetical protein